MSVHVLDCYVEPYMYLPVYMLLCWVQFFPEIFVIGVTYCLIEFVGSVTRIEKHGFLHDMVVFEHLHLVMLENLF